MKSISAIVNARVITPYGILPSAGVRVNGTKIAEIVRDLPPDSWDHCLDAHGMILAPGFVEKHVHGGDGADFVDGNREAIETILRFYAGRGVTSVQGTTTAAPAEMLVPVLETARRWRDDEKSPGAGIITIY